jgi:NADH pyrophosphatase NudC (nudix superfamily)
VFWENPVPVVAALVEYKDKVVLARNAKWPKGIFSLITGYLEKNESPDKAILREVKEEIGLEGKVKKFIGHYSFPKMNQIIMAYWVIATGDLTTNHEIAEVELVNLNDLKQKSFGKLAITQEIVDDWARMGE